MILSKLTRYERESPSLEPMVSAHPGNSAATISAISRTRWLASLRPTLKTWSWTTSRGAATAARMASQMSATCTIGRHGLPSEVMLITPVVHA